MAAWVSGDPLRMMGWVDEGGPGRVGSLLQLLFLGGSTRVVYKGGGERCPDWVGGGDMQRRKTSGVRDRAMGRQGRILPRPAMTLRVGSTFTVFGPRSCLERGGGELQSKTP